MKNMLLIASLSLISITFLIFSYNKNEKSTDQHNRHRYGKNEKNDRSHRKNKNNNKVKSSEKTNDEKLNNQSTTAYYTANDGSIAVAGTVVGGTVINTEKSGTVIDMKKMENNHRMEEVKSVDGSLVSTPIEKKWTSYYSS